MSKHNKHLHEEATKRPLSVENEPILTEEQTEAAGEQTENVKEKAEAAGEQTGEAETEGNEGVEPKAGELTDAERVRELTEKVEALEDTKLRLMAEFENFRRRTNREKQELAESAGERIFKDMLPLMDDMERALSAMEKTDDIDAVREGIKLIHQKFQTFLDHENVHPISTEGADFNTDLHEAITTFAAGEEKKGKVIDCTQKGYMLGEKVIRFAKVVVGE